jgi:hypothetical protein
LHCAVLFLVICCSVGILTGLSDWREWRVIGMAAAEMRNKSCPLVTLVFNLDFQ